MQSKVPGVKSVISKASGSKADCLTEPGDKIHFGGLFLEVRMSVSSKNLSVHYPKSIDHSGVVEVDKIILQLFRSNLHNIYRILKPRNGS